MKCPAAPRRAPRFRLGLLALLAMAGCAAPGLHEGEDRQAVIDRIVASTVKVTLERDGHRIGVGSGVVVACDPGEPGQLPVAYVLTAEHLLGGKSGAAAYVRPGRPSARRQKLLAEVVRRGSAETLDLALLRVPGLAAIPAPLAESNDAQLGEEILVVGFPWGKGLRMFSGIVSQLSATGQETDEWAAGENTESAMMVDASVVNGVSGGGVFRSATGSLLGVVEGFGTAAVAVKGRSETYSVNLPVPGGTYVIPMAGIHDFLRAAGILVR